MGVKGLVAYEEELSARRIELSGPHEKEPHAVFDNHHELHRASGIGDVAVTLVFSDDAVPLAKAVANNTAVLKSASWVVMVVIDGESPPSKGATAEVRRTERDQAKARSHELANQKQVQRTLQRGQFPFRATWWQR